MSRIPKFADESAFPNPGARRLTESEREDSLLPQQWGLTKREYFASLVLQGIAATHDGHVSDVSRYAVRLADALIEELSK